MEASEERRWPAAVGVMAPVVERLYDAANAAGGGHLHEPDRAGIPLADSQ